MPNLLELLCKIRTFRITGWYGTGEMPLLARHSWVVNRLFNQATPLKSTPCSYQSAKVLIVWSPLRSHHSEGVVKPYFLGNSFQSPTTICSRRNYSYIVSLTPHSPLRNCFQPRSSSQLLVPVKFDCPRKPANSGRSLTLPAARYLCRQRSRPPPLVRAVTSN